VISGPRIRPLISPSSEEVLNENVNQKEHKSVVRI
jgi:hypothetical protein